jgi:hypothetical protein
MKNYGRTSVHEFLGDRVVYRNLRAMDPRLPSLAEIRSEVGAREGSTPRKSEAAYGRVIVQLLRKAQSMERPGLAIERLVYVGDTRLNDGTAFANICRAGGWPGMAFIGAERDEPARVEVAREEHGTLFLANRWTALAAFDDYCGEQGFRLDGRTAVIVDLDKTALGARGRNDQVIDRARVEAVRRTVGNLLGDGFDAAGFQAAYDLLNQPEFHPFTADNQDYLAYICLILGSGLQSLARLVEAVRGGQMASFRQFIGEADGRAGQLPGRLQEIHDEVFGLVKEGDPTPFKTFRHNEYETTVGRMGWLDDGAAVEVLLAKEIVITQEVREAALAWREKGSLLFGLSDKPDEASIPREALAAQGYRAIHRMESHAVGP